MAVPNPDSELKRLSSTLRRGIPSLVLISGPSGFFRAEAMDTIVEALPEDAEVRSVSGDQDTDGSELQDLRGASLFGNGSWLVVRRGEGWIGQHGAALAGVLPKIRAGCGLVLETKKLDKRTKVGKALAKMADGYEFRDLYTEPYDRSRSPLEAEMVAWIAGRAKARGMPLRREAALLLMTSVGTDPAEVLAEVDRLAVGLGERKGKPVGPDELRGALTCSFESTPFELAEAILDFDRPRATRSLEAMYRRGVRGRDGSSVDQGGVFPFVTSWLYQALAKAYDGRFLLDQGVGLRDVPRRLGVRVFVDRFTRQVRDNPERRLRRGLLLLHEAQRELRNTGEDPAWILRRFLVGYFAESA